MNNYFVDSTIWVDFFRGRKSSVKELVMPLIEEDKIYYNGIVLSELLIGAINESEFDFLKDNFQGLHYLETDYEIFEKASLMGYKMRKKGMLIPLSDLLIALHCRQTNLTLITMDKHFKIINNEFPFSLYFINQR
ncbi:MAG: hypothetical protein A2Y62_19155 [Candidatus Fischerbacteria bacterium RBG_13_37_8]|uniref:PIN domain-containing protein n=1 Tax=Candidatus Fischerbacteria bacterium RBG_13_37_8 TaxID=1817863 RepID=A0A1F5VR87_9BACT|nr:MAG: hypothetical protein A2Y62_19155 [Candidatus Fischerbacteria bacterium RBG_13_37_8]